MAVTWDLLPCGLAGLDAFLLLHSTHPRPDRLASVPASWADGQAGWPSSDWWRTASREEPIEVQKTLSPDRQITLRSDTFRRRDGRRPCSTTFYLATSSHSSLTSWVPMTSSDGKKTSLKSWCLRGSAQTCTQSVNLASG